MKRNLVMLAVAIALLFAVALPVAMPTETAAVGKAFESSVVALRIHFDAPMLKADPDCPNGVPSGGGC